MNLLYDLEITQPSFSTKRHGGGKYGEMVFFGIIERGFNFCCYYDSSKWINPEVITSCEKQGIKLFDTTKISLEEIIEKEKISLIYSALPGDFSQKCPCRFLGTIHGLRDLETPLDMNILRYNISLREFLRFVFRKLFPRFFQKKQIRKLNAKIENSNFSFVTISNHSKYSFYTYFPHFRDKNIPVFYSPFTSEVSKTTQKSQTEKYFFMVSGNRWEKNNLRAIIALDQLFSENSLNGFKVKIAGAKKDSYRYKIKNKHCFEFLDYVDEASLNELYAGAYCFIYPSLNEGFGYPPLEAMNYEVPVLASPYSSIPEVCGDAVIYFNPFSISEIKNRILMILNQQIYDQYKQKSGERFQHIYEKQKTDLNTLIDYIFEMTNSKI